MPILAAWLQMDVTMIAKMVGGIAMVATSLLLGRSGSSPIMFIFQIAQLLVQRVPLLCARANQAMRDI